jgi:hypothetical protein
MRTFESTTSLPLIGFLSAVDQLLVDERERKLVKAPGTARRLAGGKRAGEVPARGPPIKADYHQAMGHLQLENAGSIRDIRPDAADAYSECKSKLAAKILAKPLRRDCPDI